MGSRLTWPEVRLREDYQGRWVALDRCRYDAKTAQPVEGDVVDSDEDLAELCARMQRSRAKHCAILFCDVEAEMPVSSRRPTPVSSLH